MHRWATLGLVVLVAAVIVGRFVFLDEDRNAPSGAVRAITCEAAEIGVDPLAFDLGVLSVSDLRAAVPGDDGELPLGVVVEPSDGEVGIVMLQAGADGTPLRLAPEAAGSEPATVATLLTFEQCESRARYDVVLELAAPACVFLIASDPTEGAFRQLPVSLGAPCDSVAPAE